MSKPFKYLCPIHQLITMMIVMMQKALGFLLVGIVALCLGACTNQQETDSAVGDSRSSVPPPSELVLEEVMAIGRDQEAPSEYLLGTPVAVTTDEQGNIYIGDNSTFSIKKYNPQGEYIQSIGEHGRGPGELLEIHSMYLDPRRGILVADRRNSKVVSFSTTGEILDTYPIDRSTMGLPSQMSRAPEGGYFFLYKTSESRPNAETQSAAATNMIHIVNDSLSKVQGHLVSLSSLGIEDDSHARRLIAPRPGQYRMQNDTTLLYTPGLYGGVIYTYQKDHAGTWRFRGRIKGFVEKEEPFSWLDSENVSREDPRVNFIHRSQEGQFFYHVNNDDRGLFVLSDGRIAHFSVSEVNGERQFWVELFDEDGELLRHGLVRIRGDGEEQDEETYRVLWKDEEDRFYLLDQSKYPVIRVLTASSLVAA